MSKKRAKYKPIYDLFIKFYPLSLEDLPGEIWKVVPAYEKYHCSNFGRVKSFWHKEPKILTPALNGDGYLIIGLCKDSKHKHFSIHRLVGELFIENPECKPEVNHVRGSFNNCFEWLEWATSSENKEHARDTGLTKSGEDNYQAKLKPAQIYEIRENPKDKTCRELAEKFNVAFQTISDIQRGLSYKNSGGSLRTQHGNRKLNDHQREEIRRRAAGEHVIDLANEYNVSQRTIYNIIREKT